MSTQSVVIIGGPPWRAGKQRCADRNGQHVGIERLGASRRATYAPRPDYWVALLWKQLMGTRVLDPGVAAGQPLRIYAQCLNGVRGGVSLEVLNIDTDAQHSLDVPMASERYTMTSPTLLSTETLLNGVPLAVTADGTLPKLVPVKERAGRLTLPPASISFLLLPKANNAVCAAAAAE